MSTTTATKPAARTKATTPKTTPAKAAAPKEQKPAPAKAKPEPKAEPAKPAPKTLIEALTTGQTILLKVRANGTKRSLPYLTVGSEGRKQAEAVAKMRADGQTVDAIAEALKVSTATARRFISNLALAEQVEAGAFDKGWEPGAKEVVVHTVTAKPTKA